MTKNDLLQEVEAFLSEHEMAPTRFGILALRNREFVRRLRRGDNITFKTAAKVKSFIEAERRKVNS